MKIRPVDASDTDAIVALWRDVFPEYNEPTKAHRDPRTNIARKLAFGDGLFWLLEVDGRVLGTAMAGYDGHRGWIYSIGVAPSQRRHGYGKALLAHALDALRARGCPKVNLQVLRGNDAGMKFWRAAGFAGDDVDCLGLRL